MVQPLPSELNLYFWPLIRIGTGNFTAGDLIAPGPSASYGGTARRRHIATIPRSLAAVRADTLQALRPNVRIDTVRQVLSSGDAIPQETRAAFHQYE